MRSTISQLIKSAIAVALWVPVLPIKFVLVIVGLVVVPVTFPNLPALFRVEPGRPFTRFEAALRNPVGGWDYLIPHPPELAVYTFGTEPIEPTQQNRRFAWRFRRAGLLASLRLVWRYSDTRYGELYLGWKLLSRPGALDFASSLRPWAVVGQ